MPLTPGPQASTQASELPGTFRVQSGLRSGRGRGRHPGRALHAPGGALVGE